MVVWTKKGWVLGDEHQGQAGGGRREGAPQLPGPGLHWACVSVLVRRGMNAGSPDRGPSRGDWSLDQKLCVGSPGGTR